MRRPYATVSFVILPGTPTDVTEGWVLFGAWAQLLLLVGLFLHYALKARGE